MTTIRSSLSPRFGDEWDRIFGKKEPPCWCGQDSGSDNARMDIVCPKHDDVRVLPPAEWAERRALAEKVMRRTGKRAAEITENDLKEERNRK